jgi:hypothetical protein
MKRLGLQHVVELAPEDVANHDWNPRWFPHKELFKLLIFKRIYQRILSCDPGFLAQMNFSGPESQLSNLGNPTGVMGPNILPPLKKA